MDGELVPWFVRSPYNGWDEDWTPGIVKADPDYITVEGISDDDTVKAYARPAFWVEIG